jgi:hypothetical protein
MEILNRLYNDPSSPAGFSSHLNLYTEAKKLNPKINRKLVSEFLEANRTYGLFKHRRVHYERSKMVPAGYMTDMQVLLFESIINIK